jgi:BTB/POZ domain
MASESVIIYVGPERKRYLIHKDLLTKQSEFFDKALNGKFKEAKENSIYLGEESPDAFDLLVGWLYQGHIPHIGSPFGRLKTLEVDVHVKDPLVADAVLQLETPGGTSLRRLLGPSQVDIYMPTVPQITHPKNEGTSKVAYQPYTEPSTGYAHATNPTIGAVDVFKSISAQKQYRGWSPEELRAADYSSDRKWSPHLSLQDLATDLNSIPAALDLNISDPVSHTLHKLTSPAPFTPPSSAHLRGIPHSAPLPTLAAAEESHQLALLNLCLLAESLCWPSLFNPSISAYAHGEASLSARRPLPPAHIALIYSRSHAASPARLLAADAAASSLQDAAAQRLYAGLGLEFPPFLGDLLASAGRLMKGPGEGAEWAWKSGACPAYHMHGSGETCARECLDGALRKESSGSRGLFGRVDNAQEARGRGQRSRAWMGSREMTALLFGEFDGF